MNAQNNLRVSLQLDAIINEMGEQNFDIVRFSSYRTALKLRFMQRKANFHLIDIWNTIESFRENGLHNSQDLSAEMTISKLETLITSIYYQLSKRLPPSQSFSLEDSISCLLSWMTMTYDPNNHGKVRVFAIKAAMAWLCSGKLVDKLRYIFSLISDLNTGFLIQTRFDALLRESLALPCSVFEPSFQYDQSLATTFFDFSQPIDLAIFTNVFLNVNLSPSCIFWVVILNRMADVECVVHPVQCNACHREPFTGFRYKCQKCFNYNLCQDCFWRGRTSGSHDPDTHSCKEYAYWKSSTKQIGHSLRKSFRCVPSNKLVLDLPEEPTRERRHNLTHVVPPSPVPSVHHFNGLHLRSGSLDLDSLHESGLKDNYKAQINKTASNFQISDDEHKIIAKYARKLSKASLNDVAHDDGNDNIIQQQNLILKLEAKNKEIMQEIRRLKKEQQDFDGRDKIKSNYAVVNAQDPLLLAELGGLRQRKEELETHLGVLQESRRELMVQLEGLMKLLKNHGNLLSVAISSGSNSASSTLNRAKGSASSTPTKSLSMQSEINSVTSNSSVNRDLLVAADSVTNAMSSLVKELHSDEEVQQESADELVKNNNKATNSDDVNSNKSLNEIDQIGDDKLESRALAASIAFT